MSRQKDPQGTATTSLKTNPGNPEEPHVDQREICPFVEGPFQIRVLLIAMLCGGVYFIQIKNFHLATHVMDHWCRRPEPFSNMSPAEWKALAIPVDPNGNYSRCTVREPPDGGTWARVVPCTGWEFDLSEYGENMVSAWNLVCERRWLKTLSVALHITTAMVVLPLAGALADRIGRKTVCFVSLTSLIMTLVASSFVANFLQYAITRSVALASASNLVILLVLLYEVTTPPRRLLYCTLAPSLGAVLELPFYFTVKLLRLNPLTSHLVLAVLALALVGSFYVLEESPLWLVAAHKEDEAELVVLRVAAVNGLSPSSGRELVRKELRIKAREPHSLQADKSHLCGELRKRSIMLVYIWTTLGWVHGHYALDRGLPASDSVVIGSYICVCAAYVALLPFLGTLRQIVNAATVSCMVFSASSALLFAVGIKGGETTLRAVIFVIQRASAMLNVGVMVFVTKSLYPVEVRGFSVCVSVQLFMISDFVEEFAFTPTTIEREEVALAVTAVLMALVCVTVNYLPSNCAPMATKTIRGT
ncbi:hypothetical protein HPB48_020762 [Haemaphysalis longicornis]|uniref:Organic cation/carnitine transporter n=1 Tax=Haemaphysalis longicornis TaxID=44386 RepID=A0A9J6H2Z7_HAELO|nr:hypothetical protein HPB48_020762 [Haemaphysalis longicornis]